MQKTLESADLLNQAKRKRDQAKRCRAIIRDVGKDHRAAALLTQYAAELEERAETLERLAGDGRIHGRAGSRPSNGSQLSSEQ